MQAQGIYFRCDCCGKREFYTFEEVKNREWIKIEVTNCDTIDLCPDCAKKFNTGMTTFMDVFNDPCVKFAK